MSKIMNTDNITIKSATEDQSASNKSLFTKG